MPLDIELRWDERVACSDDTVEIRSAFVDLVKTRTDHLAERDVFVAQSRAHIDLGEADAALATKHSTEAEGPIISGKIFLTRCSCSFRRGGSRKVLDMKTRCSFGVIIVAYNLGIASDFAAGGSFLATC